MATLCRSLVAIVFNGITICWYDEITSFYFLDTKGKFGTSSLFYRFGQRHLGQFGRLHLHLNEIIRGIESRCSMLGIGHKLVVHLVLSNLTARTLHIGLCGNAIGEGGIVIYLILHRTAVSSLYYQRLSSLIVGQVVGLDRSGSGGLG